MSRRSLEAHPGNRAAGNFILIMLAVLLAALSTTIGSGVEQSVRQQPAFHSAVTAKTDVASAPRGLFVVEPASHQARRYHPAFETSDSAGALGFWILMSLFGLLLGAAAAPGLIQKLRKQD